MVQQRIEKVTVCLALLAVAAFATGCFRVHVDKDADGKEKNVQVDTPFGGVHVNTNQTTASDLGLPAYPGAHLVSDDDKHKSADVHLGFGEWELRVRAVSYGSADTQDQVTAFYRKAMARYGDVITCQGHGPVGTPAATSQGLTCSDSGQSSNVHINDSDFGNGGNVELKAGSKRHQHIVGFETSKSGETRFALVALDLPAGIDKDSKSD